MITITNHTKFRVYLHRAVHADPGGPALVSAEHFGMINRIPGLRAMLTSGELQASEDAKAAAPEVTKEADAEPEAPKPKTWRQPSRAEIEASEDAEELAGWIEKGLTKTKAAAARDRLADLAGGE